ncbi:hypothetical protein N9Z64_00515, partial [bacterium]|nr:hypothetical protein [bacterium]
MSQISTEETRRLLAIFAVLSCLGLTAPNTQVCSADQANRNEKLEAYPKTFKITGKRDPLQLIVTVSQNEQTLDVTRDCNYDTDTDMVAVSETGLVSPKVNGQTTITIRWKNLTTQVTI